VCKNKNLMMLGGEEEEAGVSVEEMIEVVDEAMKPRLALHNLVGFTTKKSLKLWGQLRYCKVINISFRNASYSMLDSTNIFL